MNIQGHELVGAFIVHALNLLGDSWAENSFKIYPDIGCFNTQAPSSAITSLCGYSTVSEARMVFI